MNSFEFILKDNNRKAFTTFFWFVFFAHVIAAFVVGVNTTFLFHKNIPLVALSCYLIAPLIFLFFNKKIPTLYFKLFLFVIMVLFWFFLKAWIPALGIALFIGVAFAILKKKSTAGFTAEKIVIEKSIFKKEYNWAEVENVVLKDHLLSIDFKNNVLIQIAIAPESYTISEKAFNQFCKQYTLI